VRSGYGISQHGAIAGISPKLGGMANADPANILWHESAIETD
jgi:hypothetical protein